MNKKYISVFKKQIYSILLIFFSILIFVLIYNSCTDDVLYSKVLNPFPQNFGMKINNGDSFTNRPDVLLSLKVPQKDTTQQKISFEMKISKKSDCTDGKWEPYVPLKKWSLNPEKKEQELPVYAQFRQERHPGVRYTYRTEEFAQTNGESNCFRTSIVYDRSPPRNLKLVSEPVDPTNQKTATFKFSGEDYSSIHFECKLLKKGRTTQASLGPILPVHNKKTHGKASKKKIKKKTSVGTTRHIASQDPWEKLESWHICASSTSTSHTSINKTKTLGIVSYGNSDLLSGPLEDGDYQFFVRAKDSSGNRSKDSLNYEWTVNSTVPSIVFLSAPCDGTESSTERNTFVDTIPIKIEASHSSHSSRKFSIQCSQNGVDWFPAFGKTRVEPPNKRLEIPKTCFKSTSLQTYPVYSDTIYSKQYTVNLKAVDDQGNAGGVSRCTWSTSPKSNEIPVNNQAPPLSGKKQVDILVITDHGRNIEKRIQALRENFKDLISPLSEVDWQIAVTSTKGNLIGAKSVDSEIQLNEPPSRISYHFGSFLPINSEPKCLHSSTTEPLVKKYILSPSSSCVDPIYCSENITNLQQTFKNTLECHLPPDSEYPNYGIRVAYSVLNKYDAASSKISLSSWDKAYLQFFRPKTDLVIIFLTNESNCRVRARCEPPMKPISPASCDVFKKSPPIPNYPDRFTVKISDFHDDLIQRFKCLFGEDKKLLVYPIVPHSFTNKEPYIDLAIKTQGTDENNVIRVDFENSDYTRGFQKISEDIVTRIEGEIRQNIKKTIKTISLDCKPSDEIPASRERPRTPSPNYFFRPLGETSFIRMTSYTSNILTNYTHTFETKDNITGSLTEHRIRIQESWRDLGQNEVKLTPVAGPSTPSTTIPRLLDGTYRVEYSCDAPST